MLNYSGTWDIVDNENFEGYMVALGEYLVAKSKFYIMIFCLYFIIYVITNNSDMFMFLFSLFFNNVRRNCIVCMCASGIHLKLCNTGIDFATRKIAGMLKPQKIIEQDGDSFNIKTLTTFRNYSCSFKIGEEFEEVTKGLDNRKCKVETYTRTYITAWQWSVVRV